MNILAITGLSLVLAFLVESLVEYLLGTIFDHAPAASQWGWLLMYVSAGAGVGLAFYYQLDLIAAIAAQAGLELAISWVGILLSGLVIGRGANYVHDFVTKYLLSKPA